MQFTQWLHRALQQYPDRLITIDQGREHTVEQFADRVARLSAGLRANGVRPGDRVGMLSLNSDRYIEYLTAVPWLGAALNAVNIRWSLAEIGYSCGSRAPRYFWWTTRSRPPPRRCALPAHVWKPSSIAEPARRRRT